MVNNITFTGNNTNWFARKIANKIPNKTFEEGQKSLNRIKWIGEKISTPENRLILGLTALMTQPFIDLRNKDVDKETRLVSFARTMAKILIGTATGVSIRRGWIEIVKATSHVGTKGQKIKYKYKRFGKEKIKEIVIKPWRKIFTPDKEEVKAENTHAYKQYQNSIGSLLAIFTMMCTNFLIDAPLTKALTNAINGQINKGVEEPKTKGGQ